MEPGSSLSERLDAACRSIRRRVPLVPDVMLVLGSGLGGLADSLEDAVAIPYSEIDGLHSSAVEGHAGNLVFGRMGEVSAVAMQGRIHLYEGHEPDEVVFGVRLMARLGASTLLITNAAGGIAEGLEPGSLMLIEDQLNLTGRSCLVGPNDDTLGPRFVDMGAAYDDSLAELAREVASSLDIPLGVGVYAGLLGPAYETPAEVRMLGTLGASAVGMSTVLEVLAARHLGVRVLGISCITNRAAGLGAEPLDHADVERVAGAARAEFGALVEAIVRRLG